MKPLLGSLVFLSLSLSAIAGESFVQTTSATTYPAPAMSSLYNANEWNVDLFGAYAEADSSDRGLFDDGTFGGGVAFNYFITRNFGLGGEGTLFDTDGDTLGSAAFNLVFRFPIAETGLAPYVFAGAGINFNADDLDSDDFEDARDRVEDDDDLRDGDDVIFLGHAGLGLEYRFTRHTSIFADARYTWSEQDDSDYGQARAGIRFSF